MRRDRRQQNKQGAAIENPFAPDAAAPEVSLPVEPRTAALPEAPGKVDLSPEAMAAEIDAPGFIAPPRTANPISTTVVPVPLPDLLPDLPPAGPSEIQVLVPDPPATPLAAPVTATPRPFPLAEHEPARDDQTAKEAPALVPPPDLAPGEPSAVTALLNQIPRPPVAPSPTPANPPTRLPPAAPPRLPDESPSFIIPRSDPLIPPEPASERVPLAAKSVSLPQLKKVTEIEPFRSCSTDGKGVRLCPPNTAGEDADRCPEQQPLPVFDATERNFIDIAYCWEAPNLFHTPLYFEDVTLERYGHTYCEPLQTVTSATKFGVQLVGLPYQMALAPVHKREYPLGYYRPGDPAPHKAYQIPYNTEAALKAAYVYTGMSFITP